MKNTVVVGTKELIFQVLLKNRRLLNSSLLLIFLFGIPAPTCNWVRAQDSDSSINNIAATSDEVEATKSYREFIEATREGSHWRESIPALARLVGMGKVALPFLLDGAGDESKKVRELCYNVLWNNFASEPAAIDLFIRTLEKTGDTHYARRIRYSCVFGLGTHKIKQAAVALRHVYENDTNLRLTAAKSLAELGYTDGFLTLYDNLGSDQYMPRYQANIGIKALTGKDLNDFSDYHWREHAMVTGGAEIRFIGFHRSITHAEDKAKRYRAIVEFHKWLEKEKPKLAALLDFSPISAEELKKATQKKLKAYEKFREQNKPRGN